jgi:hypothetical protein
MCCIHHGLAERRRLLAYCVSTAALLSKFGESFALLIGQYMSQERVHFVPVEESLKIAEHLLASDATFLTFLENF